MTNRFSKPLEKILKAGGWFAGRQTNCEIDKLVFPMHGPGRQFLMEFGTLLLGTFIYPSAQEANYSYQYRDRIAVANLPNCLPVASSWFWCEGELWLDDSGCVYQADDYRLAMVSENIDDALEILLVREKQIPSDFPKWNINPRPHNPHDLGVTK
jgi:hypothetical protein